MKKINLICPKCGHEFSFKNYWHWVWHSPFHWLMLETIADRPYEIRKTKCPHCGKKSWMRKDAAVR